MANFSESGKIPIDFKTPIEPKKMKIKIKKKNTEYNREKIPQQIDFNLLLHDIGSVKATKVVCVKVNCIRPQYQNLKEWMLDPLNVYIARRGIVFIDGSRFPKQNSIWANPYKMGKDGTREEIINKYRIYITDKLISGKIEQMELENLKGKNLGCWCEPPAQCHGHVLLDLIHKST